MDAQNKKYPNRMTANNKCKTINPELKFSSHTHNKKSSKSKEKKEEEKKNEDNKKIEEKEESKLEAKININSITNNNNSHNIYVINNYFEEKKNNLNINKNLPIGKWKDGKRYDRKGVEIKKGGKQKLTFVDKIGKGKLIETIPIESFKEYNLIEEVSEDRKNSCCYIY